MLNLLIITFILECSYFPSYNVYYGVNQKEYEKVDMENAYDINFSIDICYKNLLFINGGINCFFHKKKKKLDFFPDCDMYRIAAGIRYEFMEIGYEHFCYHPVFPFSSGRDWNDEPLINTTILEGGYDKLYLKIEVEYGKN